MCTFLGTAGKISENDISEKVIKASEITFLEGYLWDKGDPQKAFNKAIINSNQSAMSLSDLFCVERHKEFFLDLVQNKLNITFANEQEIMGLIGTNKFSDVIEFSKKIKKLMVITRGENGAIAIHNDTIEECSTKKNLKIKDLTGIGIFLFSFKTSFPLFSFDNSWFIFWGHQFSSKFISFFQIV